MEKKARILIVEDEAIVAKTIERRLESLGYVIVAICQNGEDAVNNALKKKPELVLDIPIIYLTAYGDETTMNRAKVTEPFGYILKPFEPGDLYRTIEIGLYKHQIDRELRESEEKFRAIFESAHDLISVSDLDGNILWTNPSWVKKLGYTIETQGDPVDKVHPEDQKRVMKAMDDLKAERCEEMVLEYRYLIANNNYLYLESTVKKVKIGGQVRLSIIAHDITEKKKMEIEMKEKLMKFKLKEGNLYLVQEASPKLSKEAFIDLLKVGYIGSILSRKPKDRYQGMKGYDHNHIWLAEKGDRKSISPQIKKIEGWFEGLSPGQAILIERFDYIIEKNGFKKTLGFLQSLNETAYLSSHIIIISVDPALLNKSEKMKLEKESNEIDPVYQGAMPHDVITLLRVVYEHNVVGTNPTYSQVGSELKISKPTCRKRVRRLINSGYLLESVSGRSKVLELSAKGRNQFDK